jgi:hypothetical protein
MAEKTTGKSQGQGRSRPQGQSRNQKQNPDSGRSGGGGGGGSRGARNGAASGERQQQGRGREQEQEQDEQAQDSGQEGQESGVGAAGTKVAQTMKQHPITTAAIGAGLTLLAAQGLRMAIGAGSKSQDQEGQEGEDGGAQGSASEEEQGDEGGEEENEQDEGGGGGFGGRLGRLGSKFGSVFRGSGQAIRRGAKSGFEQGRQGAEQSWAGHPLLLAGVALAVGAAAGYLIPSTSQEDRLMGETSDKLTGRIKKGGQAFFRQGRTIAGKVVHEAVNSTAESIEREGLSPDRLGKKVKKVFGNVREAVSNAIEED